MADRESDVETAASDAEELEEIDDAMNFSTSDDLDEAELDGDDDDLEAATSSVSTRLVDDGRGSIGRRRPGRPRSCRAFDRDRRDRGRR